jgi:S-adenosylmethionine/arginine decarboxylase-like enzyme
MRDSYKRLIVNGERYYGKHLILSAAQCNENLLDLKIMTDFITQLVDKIDMRAFGEPVVARFGGGQEIGISGVQLIETSAITIHTNDNARDMYLDVFSCKDFDENVVVAFINELFAPENITQQTILRK